MPTFVSQRLFYLPEHQEEVAAIRKREEALDSYMFGKHIEAIGLSTRHRRMNQERLEREAPSPSFFDSRKWEVCKFIIIWIAAMVVTCVAIYCLTYLLAAHFSLIPIA